MYQVIREVMQYLFFWWIVLMIAYGYREPDAHRLSTSMEKTFLNLGNENSSFTFQRDSEYDLFKVCSYIYLTLPIFRSTISLISLTTYLPTYLPTHLPFYLPTYLSTYLFSVLPTHPLTYPPTNLPTHQLTYIPTFPSSSSSLFNCLPSCLRTSLPT